MKNVLYSDILGDLSYHIELSQDDKDLVNTFFTGAAHHLKRHHEAKDKDTKHFHLTRHRIHLRLMMQLVHDRGDFSKAMDKTNRDLEFRETWNPDFTIMPDPGMFRKMAPDWRYPVGEAHCSDHYLHRDDIISNKSVRLLAN